MFGFIKKIFSYIITAISGIFQEDSSWSITRVGFLLIILYGEYMGLEMLKIERFSGIDIAAVLGACFTAATALKGVSKKYEVQGYSMPGSSYMKQTTEMKQ